MVQTRSAQSPSSTFALLDALLAGNSSRAKLLLGQDPQRAHLGGPSGFGNLHAAALTDSHRLVAPLVAAGLDVDQQIGTLDGPAAFALRQFLREHSKLPSSKLCAVFRGVSPLHMACWLGHQSMVLALLQAGADTELACLEGRTALAIACYFLDCRPKRSLAIIEALLDAGADPLCADFHGIGSLVLSPHCPPQMQSLLLNRVMSRYGVPGGGAPEAAAAGPPAGGLDGSDGGAGPSSGAAGGAAAALPGPKREEDEAAHMQHPMLQLTPEKHADVLQAALTAKHWPAFDSFLAATSPEVEYPVHAVNRILAQAIISGEVPLVLRILGSGLRPNAAGCNSQGHPHVAVAAVHGHEGVLDVLCQHGGSVTLKALHHATDTRSLKGLRLLLSRGRPPVLTSEEPVHIGGAHSRTGELCVMLRLLRDTAFRLRYCYRVDHPRHAADSLAMVEALADAGYRPTVYPQAIVHNGWIDLQGRLVQDYDPTQDKPAAFDLLGVNKYTWLAARQEPWTPASHCRWPPKFQEAVRQLLLVYHAGRVGGGSGREPRDEVLPDRALTRAAKRARLQLEQLPKQRPSSAATSRPAEACMPAARGAAGKGGRGKRSKRRGLAGGSRPEEADAAAPGTAADCTTASPAGRGLARAAPAGERPALAALPRELLLHIIQQAAYPISAWVDAADGREHAPNTLQLWFNYH